MVLVSHKYKFIYIKNKKVAGSSVESFFGKYCINPNKNYQYTDKVDLHIDDYGIVGARTVNGKGQNLWGEHKRADAILKDLGEKKFNEYIKFCVIRNPYDKMVSKFFWKKKNVDEDSLDQFYKFCKQHVMVNLPIHSINNKSVCDYFIRYENLEEDIINLCKKLKITDYDIKYLPTHKKGCRGKNDGYRKFYINKNNKRAEKARNRVYENHKKEFQLFGYQF
tara:strand:- start:423 stop:1088 length:666 start_codon:yes stop_codon:yes gene_type:complete